MIDIATIKDISGKVKYSTPVNAGCVWKKELMKHDYVLLKFSLPELIDFRISDYIETPMGKYELLDIVYPSFNQSTGGYDYELTFHAYYWKWKNKMMLYNRQYSKEASWSLTRSAKDHLSIVLDNLNALGYLYNGKNYEINIGDSVDKTAKLISYNNTSLLDALNVIAENWDCEWWIVDNQIHLGRCEYNTTLDFTLGENVRSMSRSASNDNLATRIYAFGSTRNIPANYRPSEGAVVEGVVQKRLMLPEGTASVDAYPDMRQEQAVESVVVFDDIYPRMLGVMKDITPKEYTDKIENEDGSTTEVKWNAYRFRDTKLIFSEEYVLPGQELRIVFTSGALNGMDFAVSFNPDKAPVEEQIFEIYRNEDYGIPLPGKEMIPKNGDEYILYGFNAQLVSDQLIPAAEQELLERAQNYLEKFKVDPSVYDCQMNVIDLHESELDLDLGTQVNLVNQTYFDVPRKSRIYGFEKQLDGSAVSYTVGYTSRYSRLAKVEGQIKEITYNGNAYSNSGGGGVYVINQYDKTTPTDRNVFSALRAMREHLSRKKADTAAGHITFDQGLTSHDFTNLFKGIVKEYLSSETFVPGFLGEGFKIYDTESGWTAEFDNLVVRNAMTIYELLISKIRAVNGGLVISPANGRIKSVGVVETDPTYYELGIEGDMQFVVGDLVRCQITESNRSRSYWVEVKQVEGDSIRCLISDFNEAIPAVGDDLVQFGNTTNKNRQGILYFTASEDGRPRMHVLDGVDSTILTGKNKTILGCLDGITDSDFPAGMQPNGYGLYSDNVFLKGKFVLSSGKTVEQDVDDKVNAIQVGGRNILRNSGQFKDNILNWYDGGGGLELDSSLQYNGYNTIQTIVGSGIQGDWYTLETGTQYTYSALIWSNEDREGRGSVPLHFWSGIDGVRDGWIDIHSLNQTLKANQWNLLYVTFSLNGGANCFRPFVYFGSGSTVFNIAYLKLEKGNKLTDWTPAPEDIQNNIEKVKAEYDANFLILSDKIESKVSRTEFNNLDEQVSNSESKISQIPDKISLAVNEIKIGGRNLMLNSNDLPQFTVVNTLPLSYVNGGNHFNNLINQERYMVSFDARLISGDGRLHCEFHGSEGDDVNIASSIFVRYGIISRYKNVNNLFFWLSNGEGEVQIKNIKFEIGNKPTDWTPAPEDVEEDATNKANSAADALRQETNANIEVLSDLIQSKVSQSEFDRLGERVSHTETEILQTPDKIKLAVNSINIGGRNYFKRSTPISAFTNYSSSAIPVIISRDGKGFIGVGNFQNDAIFYLSGLFDKPGWYTFSFKGRVNSVGWSHDIMAFYRNKQNQDVNQMIGNAEFLANEDTHFTFSFFIDPSDYGSLGNIFLKDMSGQTYFITDMKFETGNKSTDWTPAPEDQPNKTELLATGVDITNQQIIMTADNTKIQSNDGQQIALFTTINGKPVVKAENIDTNNLTARKIETALNGNRVIIDPSTRDIRIMNARNQEMIRIGFFEEDIEYGEAIFPMIILRNYDSNGTINSDCKISTGTISQYLYTKVNGVDTHLDMYLDPIRGLQFSQNGIVTKLYSRK